MSSDSLKKDDQTSSAPSHQAQTSDPTTVDHTPGDESSVAPTIPSEDAAPTAIAAEHVVPEKQAEQSPKPPADPNKPGEPRESSVRAEPQKESDKRKTSASGADAKPQPDSKGWFAQLVPVIAVIVGAMLGTGSSYFILQRQLKAQLDQFLLDRKISVLKDYSESNSRLAAAVLAKVHQTLSRLEYAKLFGSTKQEQSEMAKSLFDAIPDAEAWRTNIEGQRVLAYAVFGVKYPTKELPKLSDADFQDYIREVLTKVKDKHAVSDKEAASLLYRTTSIYEQSITQSLEDENSNIRELATLVAHQ